MKFFLTALLAAPVVMGRSCRSRHSHTSRVSTVAPSSVSTVSASILPISTASSQPSSVVDNSSEEVSTIVSQSVSVPKTTLSTAVVVSSTKSSSSAAAASSTASSSSDSTDSSEELSSTSYSGESTFYGGNLSGGNCMFTTYTLPSNIYGTAYSGAVWNNAAECGACIEVTGPSGTIKAMIVDQCPECAQGHLDLFPDAFTAVGGTDGVVSTSYKFVECGITSPLVLHNKSGTSEYWFSMQVVNHNEPVESLEVSTDGGSTWESTTRQDYNFFENSSGFGVTSMKIRVTSTTGKTVTVSNVGVTSEAQYTATANF